MLNIPVSQIPIFTGQSVHTDLVFSIFYDDLRIRKFREKKIARQHKLK